jgi:hypothetical protein
MNTPVLNSIVYEIHRRADKEWAEDGNDFTVTITAEEYKALCKEEFDNALEASKQ